MAHVADRASHHEVSVARRFVFGTSAWSVALAPLLGSNMPQPASVSVTSGMRELRSIQISSAGKTARTIPRSLWGGQGRGVSDGIGVYFGSQTATPTRESAVP